LGGKVTWETAVTFNKMADFMLAVAKRIERARWGYSEEVDAECAFSRAIEVVGEAIREEVEAMQQVKKQDEPKEADKAG
jgi:hypothetical protein